MQQFLFAFKCVNFKLLALILFLVPVHNCSTVSNSNSSSTSAPSGFGSPRTRVLPSLDSWTPPSGDPESNGTSPQGGTNRDPPTKSSCRNNLDTHDGPIVTGRPEDILFNLTHRFFDTSHGFIPGISYKVSLRSMEAVQYFSLSSLSDSEEFRGQFFSENNSPSDCNGGATVTGHLRRGSSLFFQWSLPSLDQILLERPTIKFRLRYRLLHQKDVIFENRFSFLIKKDCDIQLRLISGNFSSLDLPKLPSESSCRVSFAHAHAQKTWSPAAAPENPGLVIWLTKLNVACDAGHLEFRARPPPDTRANASATAKRFCGKLEEVPPTQRHLYYPSTPQGETSFPTIHILGSPVFSLSYELVDHCYNVTLTNRLDSFLVRAQPSLDCNFKIALPYGNQVLLSFHVNFPPSPSPAPDSALANAADQHVQFYSKSSHSSNFKYERNSLSNTGAPSSASTNPRESLSNDILPSSDLAGGFPREGGQGKSGVNGSHGRAVGFVPASEDLRCANLLIHYVETDGSWMFCADQIDYPQRLELLSTSSTVYLHFKSLPVAEGPFPVVLVKYEAVPIPELVERCPFGSVAVGHSCVSVVEERPLPWAEAEQECRKTGGHLLTILTQSAEETINRILINSPKYNDDNSYWIGASDLNHEGDFRWTDASPVSYTNWFPGWSQFGSYNRQPSDDGISEEDCVELRRSFHLPPSAHHQSSPLSTNHNPLLSRPFHPLPIRPPKFASQSRTVNTFMWNDRHCSTPNFFICQTLQNANVKELADSAKTFDCNRSISLSSEHPSATVVSPGFPHMYPDNAFCLVEISAPPTHRLIIDFDELVIENESVCSYDYIELLEIEEDSDDDVGNSREGNRGNELGEEMTSSVAPKRLCGDWGDRLKLLRHKSSSSRLRMLFVSDYSHHFPGFKARVSMVHAGLECSDDRMLMYNNSCYMVVSYPQVTWHTAKEICTGLRARLASVHSIEEESFIITRIRESKDYSTNTIYWLGATFEALGRWRWQDGSLLNFSAWLPNNVEDHNRLHGLNCLSIKWSPAPLQHLSNGLHMVPERCQLIGGYVCKRDVQVPGSSLNLNETINGTEGKLSSPNYPAPYYNDLDYYVQIESGESTRIVIQFESLDLEHQTECLYDFIELRSIAPDAEPVKFCGHHEPPFLNGLNFVSEKNKVLVRFHSDYSVSGFGFSASWHAVDVAGCPQQTLTAQQGVITSPNFPRFLLSHLDCTTTILAPAGKKVWLEILEYDMGFPDEDAFKEEKLRINVGADDTAFEPFQISHFLNDGAFLSYGEELRLHLKTGRSPQGRGFKAAYKVVDSVLSERIVDLSNTSRGYLLQLNYPASPPEDLDYSQHLTVPVGYVISLNAQKVVLLKNGSEEDTLCSEGDRSMIEIKDTYRSKNGTVWRLCAAKSQDPPLFSVNSFLNSIHIRQISQTTSKTYFNISVKTMRDTSYKHKLREVASESIETCTPNSCQNGGKCVDVNEEKKICQCSGHYTGMFCALTMCDLEPCLFGKCELSPSGFQCVCQPGYRGANCDIKNRPCADNPCEGRGECVERSETTFSCRCHAWWEGPRCERRLIHIPFKPLHQRMLQEPFWLGLITVFVVMGIIGTFWCCRRHLPEKLEKLLAEEADRNRRYANPSSCRVPSVRANLGQAVGSGVGSGGGAAGGATPSSAHAGAAPPRTIFDRLGIRKTSLLSLTSPLQTNRTFSLDDLLKHSPKRNNKLEKRVTFARLLSKVSTEISSGSEDTVQITKDPAADLAWTHSDGSAKGEPKRRPGRLSLDIGAPSNKAASADSIIAMFRNFSADAMQGSGGRFNSMMSVASTLSASTPQDDPTATPTGPWQGSDLSLSSALRSPTSSSNPPSPVLARRHSNTIQISVLEPHSAQTSSSLLHPPTILLEASNKCLSPIRELPTPAPSPALSPVFRRKNGDKESTQEDTSIFLSVPTEYYTRLERRSSEGMTKQGKPTSLNLNIPTVTVEEPSPTGSLPTLRISPGSPPPRKEPFMSSKEPFMSSKELLSLEEAATLGPPIITITYSMSEVESDSEPAGKGKAPSPGAGGMDYLSPFSVGTSRAEHASESNLSSSGYSTGPSRCGSNNPLCPSEPEDHPPRRPSPLLRTPTAAERARVARVMRQRSDSETLSDDFHLESNDEGFSTDHLTAHPAMADPEPEGPAAPVPPPRRSRPVNLERFSSTHKSKCFSSVESDLDCLRTPTPSARSAEDVFLDVSNRGPKLSPELGASPESPPGALSPSLSPLSDRRGDLSSSPHGRLSPSLAGRLAESDGMCDFGSDGKKQAGEKCRHRKRRRRNKGVGGPLAGTTFSLQNLLDVPGKRSSETYTLARSRQSPKRRSKARHIANSSTSSSSAESLSSLRFSRKSERGAKELREKSRTCEEGKTCLEAPVLNPRLKRSCSSSEKLYSYKNSSIMLENEASTEPLLATSSASSKNTGFFIVSPRGRTDQTYD